MFCKVLALQIVLLLAVKPSSQFHETLALMEIVPKNINENIAISPLSINTALALAYMGAEGKTADELRLSLELGTKGTSKENTAKHFKNIMHSLTRNSKITLKIANRIYVSSALKLAPKFQRIAKKYFGAKGEEVDFSDSARTAKKINNWVEGQTAGKIKNLISPDSINAATSIVLINAIYLKAQWAIPFRKSSTRKQNFHLSQTHQIEVDMMHTSGTFEFADISALDATAVILPYAGHQMKMLLMLPNKRDGHRDLLSKMEPMRPKENFKFHATEMEVFLPKFKIDFGVSLVPLLHKLGVHDMFTKSANFSSLIKGQGSSLAVSDVIHKVFLDVNEEGTEAAASTSVGLVFKSAGPQFIADHPFYFAIYKDETILFGGSVTNPHL